MFLKNMIKYLILSTLSRIDKKLNLTCSRKIVKSIGNKILSLFELFKLFVVDVLSIIFNM